MPAAPLPLDEAERLAALRSYDVLDSQSEASFDGIASLAAKLTGSPVALVSLVDAERQWFKARQGTSVSETPREHSFCAHSILNPHEMTVVPDAARDPRFADNPVVSGEAGIRFYAGVPLVNPQGFALGTLCVLDHRPRALSDDERDSLAKLGEAVVTALELRRALAQLHRLALTDALTGLHNRCAFLDVLARAIARQKRHGDGFALLYLDLDGMKGINDRHGHGAGDQVLCAAAGTLVSCLREEDVVARLGGDEFAALLVGHGVEGAPAGERVTAGIRARMARDGWPVTASVGTVTFRTPPDSVEEALAAADAAMYQAKRAGRNQVLHRDHLPASPIVDAACATETGPSAR